MGVRIYCAELRWYNAFSNVNTFESKFFLIVTRMVISGSSFAEIKLRHVSVCVNVTSPETPSNGP